MNVQVIVEIEYEDKIKTIPSACCVFDATESFQ